jgi:hypothetical protein
MKPTHSPDVADTIGLIRAGILILPLGAALKLIGNLDTFNSAGYGVPQPTEAATVTTPGFFLGGLTDSILPVLLSPFAVLALFAYLLPHGQRPHADRGPNLRLARRRCHPSALGVINYLIPALGHAYQADQPRAMDITARFFTWSRGAMVYPACSSRSGQSCCHRHVAIRRAARRRYSVVRRLHRADRRTGAPAFGAHGWRRPRAGRRPLDRGGDPPRPERRRSDHARTRPMTRITRRGIDYRFSGAAFADNRRWDVNRGLPERGPADRIRRPVWRSPRRVAHPKNPQPFPE